MLLWIGLAVGSFLNVVIYRLPVMLNRQWDTQAREQLTMDTENAAPQEAFNLLVPRSRCPSCGHAITARENIPLVSWFLLKRKCAGCNATIAMRYPIVELLTGITTLAVIATFGFTWFGVAALGYSYTLIALTYIDFDTQLLPDQMTLPAIASSSSAVGFSNASSLSSLASPPSSLKKPAARSSRWMTG